MSVIKDVKVKVSDRKKLSFHMERFETAEEVVKTCQNREVTGSAFHDMKRKTDYDDWEGCRSYDEALELMRVGYQPTVEKLQKGLKISKSGSGTRFGFRNNVVGFAPVVPLAMQGVPNNMMDMTMKPIKSKVVDVYYDMTMCCGTSSREIIEAGQKVLGAILELEKQGYRFNLYAVQTYTGSESCDMMVVKVKSASRPLDIKRVSTPLTHTSFFRVIGFDWYSKVPGGTYRAGYGHALAYDYNTEKLQEIGRSLFGKNAIYISAKEATASGQKHFEEVFSDNGKCKKR